MLVVDIIKKLGEFDLKIKFSLTDERMAMLGASGCGKSMTLKCIAGIETPDSGKIILNDRVLYDSEKKINLPPQRRGVGYLFQNYALFPNMTVKENIGFALKGNGKKELIIKEYIKKLRLNGLEEKLPAQLSGGQQQRTALARMLALDTEIIMLDEPLSALDSFLKWELEQEFLEIFSNFDKPILYVSHDRGEVYRLCNKIAIFEQGEIISLSTKDKLFEKPCTVTASVLTGCKNISPAAGTLAHSILAKDWGIMLQAPNHMAKEKIKYVAVRSHLLTLKTAGCDNVFNAQIIKIIEDVFEWIVLLKMTPQALKPFRWVISKKEAPILVQENYITVGIETKNIIFLER